MGVANRSLDLSRYTTQHLVKTEELNKMISYAEQRSDCRMALLRRALGDVAATNCGRCDVCQKQMPPDTSDDCAALHWLSMRPVPITPSKTYRISSGFSLLDGKLRTLQFLRFMKERAVNDSVDPELISLLIKQIASLNTPIGSLVILPSRTWKAQQSFAKALSEQLNVPFFSDLLVWKTPPEKRQGELLNNDQRYYNVHEKMEARLPARAPSGPILLFDDYIGSGATIKEAARSLRKTLDQPLIPITIAAIKWRLGKSGFI